MKEKNINIKEKRTDFISMIKFFWNPSVEEKSDEEEILENNVITEKDKKELLRALKDTEKLGTDMLTISSRAKKSPINKVKNNITSSVKSNGVSKGGKRLKREENQLEK